MDRCEGTVQSLTVDQSALTFYSRDTAVQAILSASSTETCGAFEYTISPDDSPVVTLDAATPRVVFSSSAPTDIATYGLASGKTYTVTMRLVNYPAADYPTGTYPNLETSVTITATLEDKCETEVY